MLVAASILMVGVPAVVIDSRSHRIPNALVIVALAAAFAIQMWAGGPAAARFALMGGIVGLHS